MQINLVQEPLHRRVYTNRKRLSTPRINHAQQPRPQGVPEHIQPFHRNLYSAPFPYKKALDYTGHFEVSERPVVRLEDDHARVTVLPSSCGRVLELFDKKLNRQLLWSPPSLCFGNLALAGPWILGGIEFNAFRYGHNIHELSTIETRKVTLGDGTEAIAMGAFDELFGCSWEVILTLVDGALVTRMNLTNHSGKDQPCLYWWTTIAVPQQWRDRVMLAPGDFLHHSMFRDGYEFDQWPIVHGVDWSTWLHQHEVMSGYLANTNSDFMGYTNEKEGWSFIHRADRHLCRGRKLWSLGSQGVHSSWWQTLAEPNWVPYAELQSGVLPTQPDTGILKAGESLSWTEIFAAETGATEGKDYAQDFATFEKRGLEKTGRRWKELNEAAFWEVQSSEVLVPADDRLEISRKIVLTGKLDDAEIERTTTDGWVAGDAWIQLLEARQTTLSPLALLALGAAYLQSNQPEKARKLLLSVADLDSEAGAYANHLLALVAADAGQKTEALEHSRRCLNKDYTDTNLFTATDQLLIGLGLHGDRKTLWQKAPAETRTSEAGRLAYASQALFDGDWQTARSLLTAPLLSIGEGSTVAWLNHKESFFGEAAELYGDGNPQAALDLLAQGSQASPQFGIGRQEDLQNVDFLFYRYLIARQQGWDYLTTSLANMILLSPAYTGSPEAIYVYRVAIAENDPTAARRRAEIEQWITTAPPTWKQSHPLRWALFQQAFEGSMDGWHELEAHPIYCHRAKFEIEQQQPVGPSSEKKNQAGVQRS